ncbi:hypothetical protein M413DRAFT_81846 [Hebeloma cylindrosporum]|uniref:Uncharacterized protein n=1 Tax=Hebeloma cylindrosporum TaxID=76867 RepID=A0A0C2Z617_HEBCY|nr:hypothetical protein M413DRAFT_81846 [Hebeloma cylindrosporum h7]
MSVTLLTPGPRASPRLVGELGIRCRILRRSNVPSTILISEGLFPIIFFRLQNLYVFSQCPPILNILFRLFCYDSVFPRALSLFTFGSGWKHTRFSKLKARRDDDAGTRLAPPKLPKDHHRLFDVLDALAAICVSRTKWMSFLSPCP